MNLSGNPVDYIAAFFGGVFLSFTPCVYPLIPVSAGYIGINAGGSKLKGFLLSLIFVSGISVTYAVLGVLASLTGKIFGAISLNPITRIIAGGIIIIFGLSMFGMFSVPQINLGRLPLGNRKGYFSTFLFGINSGLIVSPCVTPVLGSILVYLSTKQNIFYGASLLFVFAYGMGTILLISGVFSALLFSLPKSGRWMNYLQKSGAVILICMGAYFIFTAIRSG